MAIDSNLVNGYKYIAQGFCEPDFADYYRLTGLTREDWLDTGRSLRFLEKYSFIDKPLPPKWRLSKERVFNLPLKKEEYLYPTHIYKDGFVSSCKIAGCLFDKAGYEALQSSLINMGEDRFFIDKVQEAYDPQPLCLSIPVRLSWEELISGGFIVSFLVYFPHGFFFLFSPSAQWGLFIANDAMTDVEILGVKSKYVSYFSPYYQYDSSFEY